MRAVLIFPPFGGLDRPSLGLHTLQGVARLGGHDVQVFYSNIIFAAEIGEAAYLTITEWPTLDMLGERIMGLSMGSTVSPELLRDLNVKIEERGRTDGCAAPPLSLCGIAEATERWLAAVEDYISSVGSCDVIGFSTTFEQTNGATMLARLCRKLAPQARLVVGGANCEAQMATAMADLIPEIDIVFSGESELTFAEYLAHPDAYLGVKIVDSPPNKNLDPIPSPDYTEFFDQLDRFLPVSSVRTTDVLQLPYESSRGCWWGQKHHCTFCGLNGNGMGYREKTPAKVSREIAEIADVSGVRRICMTDNIMPFSYFRTLIPLLAEQESDLDIFYEQKANMSIEKVFNLRQAGVQRIQPGIEALNDDLLRLMKKGTTGRQNLALLRYARSVGIYVAWNMLSGFPGDQEEWYRETLEMVPYLHHLTPPTGLCKLSIDRFSPYFENSKEYGLWNVTPHPSYRSAFPHVRKLEDLAYHFVAESNGLSIDNSRVIRDLRDATDLWRDSWDHQLRPGGPPCLEVVETQEADGYLLVDTRGIAGTKFIQQLSFEQAEAALTFQKTKTRATVWGRQNFVCIEAEQGYLPLACAAPSTIMRFESRVERPHDAVAVA